jgi:hypothetical protein
MRIDGTELFNANLAIGKALIWAGIINSKINKCFRDRHYLIEKGSRDGSFDV